MPCTPRPGPPQCVQDSKARNWYGYPSETVNVNRATAYADCCSECLSRGDFCAAFSVNSDTGKSAAAAAGKRRAGSARVGAACTTCDADCDIYTQMPERLCKAGERLQRDTYTTCGIPSLGSAHIATS